jgi:hypothetical protein
VRRHRDGRTPSNPDVFAQDVLQSFDGGKLSRVIESETYCVQLSTFAARVVATRR